jgi:hypothetical protein
VWPAAQIRRVFRVYAAVVRSIYLLMVVSALAVGCVALMEFSSEFLRPGGRGPLDIQDLVVIGFLIACVAPATRAAIRLVRFHELVPDAHLRERPVVATLVTIPAALGVLLLYLVARIWLDIQPWGHDDVGGPVAGATILAVLFHLFALLTGEMVLVGGADPGANIRSVPDC